MIHVIQHHLSADNRSLLEGMFADRKRLFVDLFGWDVPVVADRFEIDQFDQDAVVYLVAVSPEGDHEASMRLMPSNKPHMLAEIFPHLCPGGVPVGPDTWESSRLCLPQRHGAARRRELRNILISAMVDFALANRVATMTGVIPEGFRKEVLAMGWQAEPLGPAICMAGGPVGAFAIHIRPDTPARLRWTGVYVGSETITDAAPALRDAADASSREHLA